MSPQVISRRSTLTGLAVSVAGGVAGFIVGRNSSAAKGKNATTGANTYGAAPATGGKQLATLDQVPAGGGLILDNQKIVLTRGTGDAVNGFSAVCTHQGCTVNSVSGGTINCPCHGSRFDAQTGAVAAGPAPSPLPKVAVVVRANAVFTA